LVRPIPGFSSILDVNVLASWRHLDCEAQTAIADSTWVGPTRPQPIEMFLSQIIGRAVLCFSADELAAKNFLPAIISAQV
jgi:hypothetical protein